jgi:P pilus assembly chaperone PapD
MSFRTRALVAAALAATPFLTPLAPARAAIGDLLVAPTRLVLNGGRGAELILSNIGDEPATYRVSVEFRRMTPDGMLEEVAEPSELEKAARDMIVYAPRRVTLAPREPQSIRVSARPPKGLPDGEYRVHLLFRAIPPATPVAQQSSPDQKGLSFKLTPVYGVTIPVIVRLGNLEAQAGISNVRVERQDGKPAVALDLSRSGRRSTFGEVRVLKAGVKDPIAISRAVAVYTEIDKRAVVVLVADDFKGAVSGPVTVQYVETYEDGTKTLAETQAVLR